MRHRLVRARTAAEEGPIGDTVAPDPQGPSGHLHRGSLEALRRRSVPQVANPGGLFDRSADTTVATIDGGMLVCRATIVAGHFDDGLAGGADVYMTLTLPGFATRRTRQTSSRTYSFPVARLAEGDVLEVGVMDQDLFFDDRIGSGSASYAGGSTLISAGAASVTCRPVDPAEVRQGRQRAVARLRSAIDELGTPEPDLTLIGFGYPVRLARAVLSAVPNALAWSTEADSEVDAMFDEAAAFEARWESALIEVIAHAATTLPPVGTNVGLVGTGRPDVE